MAGKNSLQGLEQLVDRGLSDPNNLFYHDILGFLKEKNWLSQKQYYKAMQYHNDGDLYSATCTLVLGLSGKICEETRAKDRYKREAYTDHLTRLHNRRYADQQLKQIKDDYAIIKFDIDHFKAINDTYGHEVGDIALKSLAQLLNRNTRVFDQVLTRARIGGEEFLVLIKGDDSDHAQKIAERIRDSFEKQLGALVYQTAKAQRMKGWRRLKDRQITASFGIGYSSECKSPYEVMMAADERLYEAKASGRNRVCG